MNNSVPGSLKKFFDEHPRVAIAFSGGTDSSYLLYAAAKCGAEFTAYTVESPFRSPIERDNAEKTATIIGIEVSIIKADPLSVPAITSNGADRCYQCKKVVFGLIRSKASEDGYDCIIDACNASDDPSQRPGMKALEEMGVLSPLREAGLTKAEIRRLSEIAGLPTWNVPSDSCLATRIPTGHTITAADLEKVACTEKELRKLGLSGFRVRAHSDNVAVIEIPKSQNALFEDVYDRVDEIMKVRFDSFTLKERIAPREN